MSLHSFFIRVALLFCDRSPKTQSKPSPSLSQQFPKRTVSREDIQPTDTLCLPIEIAMSARLELVMRDPDPWAVAKQAFNLISDYVQPGSPISPGQAALQLNSLSPGQRALQDGEEAEEPASFLLEFWETLISVARQVPFDHPSQERLVELVAGLNELASESDEAVVSSRHTRRPSSTLLMILTQSGNARSIWRGFDRLDNVLDDVWKGTSRFSVISFQRHWALTHMIL